MPPILMWVLVVVAAAVCGALGYYFGGENRKRTAEAKIGSAEEEAKRIVRWYLRRWSSASTFLVKTDLPIRWSVWRRSL